MPQLAELRMDAKKEKRIMLVKDKPIGKPGYHGYKVGPCNEISSIVNIR